VHNRNPISQRFDRVGRAVGEVRKVVSVGQRGEADDALRRALAVDSVASGACCLENLLTGRADWHGSAGRRLNWRLTIAGPNGDSGRK